MVTGDSSSPHESGPVNTSGPMNGGQIDEESHLTLTEPETETKALNSTNGGQTNDESHLTQNEPETEAKASNSTIDGDNKSTEAMARAISSMLTSVMTEFDFRAGNVIRSQDMLGGSIDRLTLELDKLLEDAPLPFVMQHAAKLTGVRKRISSLNSVLKVIQHRIDNIDRMLSAGLSHENEAIRKHAESSNADHADRADQLM
ncbi:hypothetical protein AMTRI_Chr02g254030 [Amborella trichopoda]|uniref:Biogenesis of lysosome-related organelles complex 1 subunit 7 n=1 Tax=Amborella trichopoda TaxID=13333 RepID=W1NQQ9_AMBTC|nr:uncharacterized protein LOC18427302 [Amborella trichopoda]ERM99271.1 hypothetical protein AMTR_s00092p00154310 [Amborella trichopoda]|eukprot:XP_006836418.1 uncharacterized protein LOC18427302 [Amborella trichopoda]